MSTQTVELLGFAAAALTTASFAPQALHTFRTRNTQGISLGMYTLMTTGVALWLIYGFLIESTPMIVANAITLALAGTIWILTVTSRQAERRHPHADPPRPTASKSPGPNR